MKRLVSILILSTFFACSNDAPENTVESVDSEAFLSALEENTEYISSGFPKASEGEKPAIMQLSGNASILKGGSVPVNIQTDISSDELFILVGVDGYDGYFKSELRSDTDGKVLYKLLFSRDLPADDFKIQFAIEDNLGKISERSFVEVSTIALEESLLQVSLSWDALNDIDLHLIQPDGKEIFYRTPGYLYDSSFYDLSNEEIEELTYEELVAYRIDDPEFMGELDLDSNPACILDSINNENISFTDINTDIIGEYIVRVDFYEDCSMEKLTNFIVTATFNGNVLENKIGPSPYFGAFEPNTHTYGEEGAGLEVMRFDITREMLGEILTSAYSEEKIHFNYRQVSSENNGKRYARVRISSK